MLALTQFIHKRMNFYDAIIFCLLHGLFSRALQFTCSFFINIFTELGTTDAGSLSTFNPQVDIEEI